MGTGEVEIMISPTGSNTIREDKLGSGKHGASRGKRKHKGVDFVCRPGQRCVAPISGRVVRTAKPYSDDDNYSGMVIEGENLTVKLFYVSPAFGIVGDFVLQGDYIGDAQDISAKYEPLVSPNLRLMIPHVHLEITNMNPNIFINIIG